MDDSMVVRAVGALMVARVRADGAGVERDAHVGRGPDGRPLPDGERVPRHAHYLRALKRGELELVELDADEVV